ncbi:MAG: AAA family ATPase [Bacilli bacterium]
MQLEGKKISIKGFRNYKEEVAYNLARKVKIFGDNGLGKSTVKEAICWGVLGTDSNGNERATTNLINNDNPKVTEVAFDFILDGEPHSIVRRKKGSSNDVYWDDKKSSTSDILKQLFVTKDIFLSIFNPYYFPNLTPKSAKEILSEVCKPIGRDVIFAELGDYLKKVMLDNGFRIPEAFLKDARAELKEQEENIIYLQGVNDGLEKKEIGKKLSFDDELIKKAEEELSKIKKTEDFNSAIKELDIEKKSAESEFNNTSYQDLLPLKDTSLLEKQRATYLKDYKENEAKIKALDNDKQYVDCPQCDAHIDVNEFKKEPLINFRNEILARGKGVAAEIEKVKEENKKIEAKNAEIEVKNIKLRESKKMALDEKVKDIEERKTKLLQAQESAKNDYTNKTSELIANIRELKSNKEEIIKHNLAVDEAIKHNEEIDKKIEANEVKINNSNNKIAQLKLAIDAGKQYNSIKVKKQAEQIGEYLDKVTIQFEVVNKDGEIKDKFAILYDGKEFNKLSNSEKIKAGLEISNLIMNLMNVKLPVFIDDAESINVIPDMNTQMISASVSKDKEIRVELEE